MSDIKEDNYDGNIAGEQDHFQKVANAFLYYRPYACGGLKRLQDNYSSLSLSHRRMLHEMPSHFQRLREAIQINQKFVESIVTSAVGMFENSQVSNIDIKMLHITPATQFEMTKVTTTIKQFYRDWSTEGSAEREMCYSPIIKEVLEYFPLNKCESRDVSILVPGSGLGRLAYELARCGYTCQGNEFSMYMLLGSNFILNQSAGVHTYTIHPWVHQVSNTWSRDHQLTTVTVPDVDPSDLPQYGLFSMAAGDFLDVYTVSNEWSCVACCFFIDTGHNVIDYIERIYQILKPGGLWINFGPLLYHYADMPGERSIELCWEDLRRIITKEIGFEIIKDERHRPSHYIQNPQSMLQMTYDCVFLVAKKPLSSSAHHNLKGSEPKLHFESNASQSSNLSMQTSIQEQNDSIQSLDSSIQNYCTSDVQQPGYDSCVDK